MQESAEISQEERGTNMAVAMIGGLEERVRNLEVELRDTVQHYEAKLSVLERHQRFAPSKEETLGTMPLQLTQGERQRVLDQLASIEEERD